ncbi:hypothetical protein, partial [Rhodobaculum claviforme]
AGPALWYSLGNALPLVTLSERYAGLHHPHPWVSAAFHTQRVAGYLMATALVAAIAVLIGG